MHLTSTKVSKLSSLKESSKEVKVVAMLRAFANTSTPLNLILLSLKFKEVKVTFLQRALAK
ncbi:1437_t:CDS:2 [Cetraspora pellucida]|uniref:1437_t:CDS:1 n=1 Tax=Cetraspora pellucida TaxID=1433469 RepID=A0A9N9FME4_9GLOM|nr:1437_t:CDS:2 [Cetraspora pellucida]